MGKAHVQDFFMIPLGMLFSAEIRTFVGTDNKVKHSCIELMSKDNRKWSLILKDFEECQAVRDLIRHLAFLDNVTPA